MASSAITYTDVLMKQLVEGWADDKGFDAEEQVCMHLEERFDVNTIEVISAIDQGEFLVLKVVTDRWQEPREFGLLSNGSLTW